MLFTCGRCLGLMTISDPSLLPVYEGHFYCMRCRKAGGYQCASQQEETALRSEEILAGSSQPGPEVSGMRSSNLRTPDHKLSVCGQREKTALPG